MIELDASKQQREPILVGSFSQEDLQRIALSAGCAVLIFGTRSVILSRDLTQQLSLQAGAVYAAQTTQRAAEPAIAY